MLLSLNRISKIHPCWLVHDIYSLSLSYHTASSSHTTIILSMLLWTSLQSYVGVSPEQSSQPWLYIRIIWEDFKTPMPEPHPRNCLKSPMPRRQLSKALQAWAMCSQGCDICWGSRLPVAGCTNVHPGSWAITTAVKIITISHISLRASQFTDFSTCYPT